MRITLDNYNLIATERLLCESALKDAGSIVEAAKLLGITRHGLKRRIIKHDIRWARVAAPATVEDEASMDDAMAERKFNAR